MVKSTTWKSGGHTTWTHHVDTPRGYTTWKCHVYTPHGHTTWTIRVDTPRGHATWTYHVDMPRGYNTWTCHVDTPRGHPAWTSHVDIPRGNITWIHHVYTPRGHTVNLPLSQVWWERIVYVVTGTWYRTWDLYLKGWAGERVFRPVWVLKVRRCSTVRSASLPISGNDFFPG